MKKPFNEVWRTEVIVIRGRKHFCISNNFVDVDGQVGGRIVADCGVDKYAKNAAKLIAAQFNAGSQGANP